MAEGAVFISSLKCFKTEVYPEPLRNIEDGEFSRVLNMPLDVVTARRPVVKSMGSESVREHFGSVTGKGKSYGGVEPTNWEAVPRLVLLLNC